MIRRALVPAAALVALAFLALPIAAVFARLSWGNLTHELSSSLVTDAIVVSLKTTVVAQVLDQ